MQRCPGRRGGAVGAGWSTFRSGLPQPETLGFSLPIVFLEAYTRQLARPELFHGSARRDLTWGAQRPRCAEGGAAVVSDRYLFYE